MDDFYVTCICEVQNHISRKPQELGNGFKEDIIAEGQAAKEKETEAIKLGVRTEMEISKKKRKAKAKKVKNVRKELNKEFEITVRREKKQYYNNICKKTWKTREVFQMISELRRRCQLKDYQKTTSN